MCIYHIQIYNQIPFLKSLQSHWQHRILLIAQVRSCYPGHMPNITISLPPPRHPFSFQQAKAPRYVSLFKSSKGKSRQFQGPP